MAVEGLCGRDLAGSAGKYVNLFGSIRVSRRLATRLRGRRRFSGASGAASRALEQEHVLENGSTMAFGLLQVDRNRKGGPTSDRSPPENLLRQRFLRPHAAVYHHM